MKEKEMVIIAEAIDKIIRNINDTEKTKDVKRTMLELCNQFPIPYE